MAIDPVCTCGHRRDVHYPNKIGLHCGVGGCLCLEFEEDNNHTHPELTAMISALRDEMATRFNALADEVDKIGSDAAIGYKSGTTPIILYRSEWAYVLRVLHEHGVTGPNSIYENLRTQCEKFDAK